jgi:bifunctional enzyme CysN/CysC
LDVVLLPSAAAATIATVNPVNGGSSFALRLDREVATQAGTVLAAAAQRPELADQVAAHVVWAGKEPMLPGRPYRLRICGRTTTAQISSLRYKLNPADLTHVAARRLEAGDVGFCNLSFSAAMIFDAHETAGKGQAQTSQFEVEDASSGEILGAGHIAFTLRRSTNIHWQALAVDKSTRASLKGQRPCCLWFTGLSGSGKSTVASLLEKRLTALQRHTYTLDGDNVRHGLNRDLGFTDADRVENIRRVVEVSKLFVEAGLIVMVSFISPFRAERRMARDVFAAGEFIEIFVDTPIDVCERRDVKGLYKKARAGQLKNFTGIDSPYEPPENPEITLNGAAATAEELVERVLQELSRRNML